MIRHQISEEDRIVIIEPSGPLSEADFQSLTAEVDRFLRRHSSLRGLLVHAKDFPGWEDFKGFISHICFVRDHHREIEKVALVSDSALTELAPKLVDHFVGAEVKGFDYENKEKALAWLRERSGGRHSR